MFSKPSSTRRGGCTDEVVVVHDGAKCNDVVNDGSLGRKKKK